jgi:Flp pilus assembly protein TadD
VAANKIGAYKDTVRFTTQALKLDMTSTKAWFLRGVAGGKLHYFEEALADLKEAIKLAPNDKSFRDEFESVKK